jgi:hypothetical protein
VQQSAVLSAFPRFPRSPPHWQHDDVETISGVVKARRTPLVSPRLRVRRQATLATTHFCPELPARGCFFELLRRCCLGRNYGFKLLTDVDGGIIRRMGPDRTEPATPNLFSTHMVQDGSTPTRRASAKEAPADTATQRHVLPRDLPNAVKYLSDTELDLLITTSVQEAKRRGRLPPSAQPNPTDEPVAKQSSSRHKGQTEIANVSLTRGQVNAVRAATKAGIKPSQIARQFGISQSDVRKVLASDAATQKRTRECRDSRS